MVLKVKSAHGSGQAAERKRQLKSTVTEGRERLMASRQQQHIKHRHKA